MEYKFSHRVQSLKPSAIREIFKYSADPSYIPLSAGNPAPDAFPFDAVNEISAKLLIDAPVSALQYGTTEGYAPLREHLMKYMREKHNFKTENDDILITSGAQQVMDLLTKSLLDEGDVVLCEAPSFIGSLNTFRSYRARLVGIPFDSDGVNLEALERALKSEKKAKFFYTIPNFQNPSGVTMSRDKRCKVYELCKKYEVMILEDNPYGDLRFRGEDVPTIKSLDEDGIVMYAGSFSKVVSPGIRVGYAIGPKPVIQKMVVCKQGEDVHSNVWAQIICHKFMTEFDYETHLLKLKEIYRKKAAVLENAMNKHLAPKNVTWNQFDGGLFAWCTLPKGINMLEYSQKALLNKVCIVPGTAFLTDENDPCSSFRINFSTPTDEQLEKGIEILGSIL